MSDKEKAVIEAAMKLAISLRVNEVRFTRLEWRLLDAISALEEVETDKLRTVNDAVKSD